MKTTPLAALVILCILVPPLPALAQGGGGRGMSFARPDTPTEFDNADLGLRFVVPANLQLYTTEKPGRFRSVLAAGRFLYIVSPGMRRASVVAKASANMTEADLEAYRAILDANPPQAKLDGFKKHSLRTVKIGRHGEKDALEFVYDARENDVPVTIRQVVFVHNGQGFTFTCTSTQAEYGGAGQSVFDPVFSRLEFR